MPDEQPVVDTAAVQAEVAGLSNEQLQAELMKFRVRQKKQQKKHQGSDQQKKYQAKQREKFKLMKAEAIKLGIWDKINAEAEKQAEAEVGAEAVTDQEEAA